MKTDPDFLIGLAAVQAGLAHPLEITASSPLEVHRLLGLEKGDPRLEALRDRANFHANEGQLELSQVLDELCSMMNTDEGAEDDTKTLIRETGRGLGTEDGLPAVSIETPGRYQFAKEHARGGMGRILLVYDEFLARRIALKEMLPQQSDLRGGSTLDAHNPALDESVRQQQARFLYEARITGLLEHPSVVPVYELGQRENGSLYYTMRFVKGRSLRIAIRDAETLTERLRLLPHFLNLCQAIAFAHSRGVIHRDIKPGNVMVGEFGETVVIDWGLARVVRPVSECRVQDELAGEFEAPVDSDAGAMGTPAYMSPEQAVGALDAATERSDVYSLGAVLYELLSGVAPYPDTSPAGALKKLLAGSPPPVSGVPNQLAAICAHAMARDPKRRYQSARELASDIERYLSGHLVGVYNYNLGELFAHFVRSFKAPLLVGALGVCVLSLTVFLGYLQVQTERDRAVQESVRAKAATQEALKAKLQAEQEFYHAAITVAHKYVADRYYDKAMAQLDRCPPRYRHWEWGYLLYLCNRDQGTYSGHAPETAWSTIFMPGGERMASSGFDGTARIWSANTGALLHTYVSGRGAVLEISPHPTRPWIACAEEGGYITLFNYEKGEVEQTWKAAEKDINCIQFHPDGKSFVTGGDDGSIRLWDLETRSEQYVVNAGNGGVEALVFDASGGLLASCDHSLDVRVWDAGTGEARGSFSGHTDRLTALAFHPSKSLLASGSRDSTVRIWNLDTGQTENVIAAHESAVWAVGFSPDGKQLATGGSDRVLFVWNTDTWEWSRVFRGHLKQIDCLAFSPDGRTILTGDDEGTLKQWDTRFPGPQTNQWELSGHTGMINHVAFSPDGAIMTTAAGHWKDADDTTARVWDANSGALLAVLEGHTGSVRHTAFHPSQAIMTTASRDGTVRVWDRRTQKLLNVLGPFESGVNTVAFPPEAPEELLAGLVDGSILRLNWRDGKLVSQWQEHDGEVLALAYSPDGRWLVSGGADDSAHVLDARTFERVQTIVVHGSRVPALAVSPDGAWLATGGHDWRINIWDTTSWKHLRTLEGHTQGVYTLQFSDDGKRLLSSSSDETTILWDTETFRDVFRIDGWVSAFRPGSHDILTGTRDVNAYLWPSFSWEPSEYDGTPGVPLGIRAETYKRNFWRPRRPN